MDGSWTVDCVCGVNFDDGEEMVNCDECGVWVHTRCSRYVKGEKMFACDKCKSKSSRNDSEETEVAQLLVELPTKTLKMDSSYHISDPPRRPFRLWTDIPIEERVHVQGIPGGDPALFGGLSSVFTPELWKCTGYIPKKFNFQYKEFPCWDDKQDAKMDEENENPVDKGAGALFSLSKDTVSSTPAKTLVGMRDSAQDGGSDRMAPSKEMKKWEGEDLDVNCAQHSGKKEQSLLRPFVIHSGKRKKEVLGTSKDGSGKKKARAVDKEADTKKRGGHTLKTVLSPTSDAKQLAFCEDRGPKTDGQSIKNRNLKEPVAQEPAPDGNLTVENYPEKSKNNLTTGEQHPSEASGLDFSFGAGLKDEKTGDQVCARVKNSPKFDVDVVKEEGVRMAVDKLNDDRGCLSESVVLKPSIEGMTGAALDVKNSLILQDSKGNMLLNSAQPNIKVELEVDHDNNAKEDLKIRSSSLSDVKLDATEHMALPPGISVDHLSENSKVNDAAVSSSQSGDHKAQDVERSSEAVSDFHTDKTDELSGDHSQSKLELDGSEGSMTVQKSSLEPKHDSRRVEGQTKLGGTIQNSPALPSQCKMVVCVGKSSSTSSTVGTSKSIVSDNGKPVNIQNHDPIIKKQVISKCSTSIKKDGAASDVVRDEDGQEMLKKTVKEHAKSSVNYALKALHSSRSSHAFVSKQSLLDSKDSVVHPSSKVLSAHNTASTSGSGESVGSLQSHNKITSSTSLQRGEKFNQSNGHPSSKVNVGSSMHLSAPANCSATLSDEELALLLHQELNSSPRVPRVPRVRQAGSLPQMVSPTATSMLMKRSSSFGGKDHNSVSRKKHKDVPKEGSRSSHEFDDEGRKMDKRPASPDQRKQELVNPADASVRKEADDGSPKPVNSVKKNMPPASPMSANSCPSSSTEANGQSFPSIRNSPRNISDDDTGIVGVPIHRTLPGLLGEIMSQGKVMPYEDLCNAVLPHWHNLRKQNGERYAYSSHSQAVLDCLRNRSEWAQLVDRGPKTNAGRKRRKPDTESLESDDTKHGKGRSSMTKEIEVKLDLESHRDEFPKGKRNTRKRRRLALQGREINEARKTHDKGGNTATVSDEEDTGPFSGSSDESIFSEVSANGSDGNGTML